jgi:flagellar biosynthesis/type III secretory pathway chaperone
MEIDWETELASFLAELSSTQDELLKLLVEKRDRLANGDTTGLAALQSREQSLSARLQQCHQRRDQLLSMAAQSGLPAGNLRTLSNAALPGAERQQINAGMRQAAARASLLQHHSLTNWVLTQRTLLYLSQLLEIIGTGGRENPTYGKSEARGARGALVDQAA